MGSVAASLYGAYDSSVGSNGPVVVSSIAVVFHGFALTINE